MYADKECKGKVEVMDLASHALEDLQIKVRILGLGSGVSDCGSRVSGLGFWVSGFGFRVSCFGFRVSYFVFWVSGFQVSGFGLRVSGVGLSGFGFRVSGFGFRAEGLPRCASAAPRKKSVALDETACIRRRFILLKSTYYSFRICQQKLLHRLAMLQIGGFRRIERRGVGWRI